MNLSVPALVSAKPIPESLRSTVNGYAGVDVPIPTFPLVLIVIRVVPPVSNARLFESLVPSIAVAPNEFPS